MIEPKTVERFRSTIRSIARHADDPEGFAQAVELLDELERLLADRLDDLRAGTHLAPGSNGYSWAELARPSGLTRQGFTQRWTRRQTAHREDNPR